MNVQSEDTVIKGWLRKSHRGSIGEMRRRFFLSEGFQVHGACATKEENARGLYACGHGYMLVWWCRLSLSDV